MTTATVTQIRPRRLRMYRLIRPRVPCALCSTPAPVMPSARPHLCASCDGELAARERTARLELVALSFAAGVAFVAVWEVVASWLR